jgi:hypothetical protein
MRYSGGGFCVLRQMLVDGGYTGINIIEVETKTEDGELKIKDPKTGKWEKLG